jgi:hypothetical protein
MDCKICNYKTEVIFEKIILQKYKSKFHRCENCNFIQTDEPIWLEEAYKSAITTLDIGLLSRNNILKKQVENIIDNYFSETRLYLDYAGGYGVFVRLMRDIGYDFYRQDDYCDNIFANYFDINDTQIKQFDIVTGFEVLEHFSNPLQEIEKVLTFSETAIFSTEIAPLSISEAEKWWYLTEETGQHIAFYSVKSMEIIAEKFNKNYYCRDGNIHIFTNKKIPNFKKKLPKSFISKLFYKKRKKESLTPKDYKYIQSILNN